MSKNLSILTLLAIFATNLFADDQKTIEVNQVLYAPVEIKMSYRDAQEFCTNSNISNQSGWRLADSFKDLKPMLRADREMQEWRLKDVSFSFNPNEPHVFYCMKESDKEAKIETEEVKRIKKEKVDSYLAKMKPISLAGKKLSSYKKESNGAAQNKIKSENEKFQKTFEVPNQIKQEENQRKESEEERFKRVIKESNEYQLSLKSNSAEKSNASDVSIESKSLVQTEKRFFKDSNLPDCTDQNLTNCYARLKINTGTFEGELGNGSFEGKGLIVNTNGGAFIGNFKNNEFISGLDIYTNVNEFFRLRDEAIEKNLSEEGRLKYVLENFRGKYYLGSFINNKRDGKGMYVDTIEGFSQNGSWKNDKFASGDTQRFGQNNSNQNTPMSRAQSQCDGYGFQKGTNAYAQCIMQMDQLIRQQDYEQQRRANIEFQCRMQKANSFLTYQTPFFVESMNRADQVYSNCMAGLPPPRSGKIDCTISGSNVYCQER